MNWLRDALKRIAAVPLGVKFVGLGVFVALAFAFYHGRVAWINLRTAALEPSFMADIASGANAAATGASPEQTGAVAARPPADYAGAPGPSPVQPAAPKPAASAAELIRPVAGADAVQPSWRRDETTSHWYYETATLLHAPAGTPVVAAAPGVVTAVAPSARGGWDVTVHHEGDWHTVYGDVFQPEVQPGSPVSGRSRLGVVWAREPGDGASGPAAVAFAAYQGGEPLNVSALWGNE